MLRYHRLVHRLRPLARPAHRYRGLLCFLFIHIVLHNRWKRIFDFATYDKAHPKLRTHFVIVIHTAFVWAIVMLSASFATKRISAWRNRDEAFHPIGDLLDSHHDDSATESRVVVIQNHQYTSKFNSGGRPKTTLYWSLILVYVFLALTYENPSDHRFRSIVEKANLVRRPSGYGRREKVFVAAMFYNNQDIIPHWSREMLKVAHYIGRDNVFFSIVESHSKDDSPKLLREFQRMLTADGIQHHIVIQDTSMPRPAPGNMDTRVRYLAAVRNLAIAPLSEGPEVYDRVIFSNDITVEADSVIELLNTRDGNYDMVCGVDTEGWGLYDAWVIRDQFGQLVSSLWPYFFDEGGSRAVWWDEPAPVFTCWNGITAFRADPLLPMHLRKANRLSTSPLPRPLPDTHPAYSADNLTSPALTPPIKFRASSPHECLSSECFLLPYDFRRQFLLDKIFLNPRVIVSYTWEHYFWFKYVLRHWLVMWWMKNVERGNQESMKTAIISLGGVDNAFNWDGGKCMKLHVLF